MALFSKFQQPQEPRRPRQYLPEHEQLRRLRKVRGVCHCRHAHLLPVEMIHLAETRSRHGTPMLVLACPHPGCNWREGYVIDYHTGQPRKLFGGIHNNGR